MKINREKEILIKKIEEKDSEILSVKGMLFEMLNSSKRAEEKEILEMQQLKRECTEINDYINKELNVTEEHSLDSVERTLQDLSNQYQKSFEESEIVENEYNKKFKIYENQKKQAKKVILLQKDVVSKAIALQTQLNEIKSDITNTILPQYRKEIHALIVHAKNVTKNVLNNYFKEKSCEKGEIQSKIKSLQRENGAIIIRSINIEKVQKIFKNANSKIDAQLKKIRKINKNVQNIIIFQRDLIRKENISRLKVLMLGTYKLYTKRTLEEASKEFQRRCIEENDLIKTKQVFPDDIELENMKSSFQENKKRHQKIIDDHLREQENIKSDLKAEIEKLEESLRE